MDDALHILWTTDNPVTAERMVFMYAINSLKNAWWEDVQVIIWGAATDLAGHNAAIQEKMKLFQEMGGHIAACRKCAEEMGLVENLEALGIEVIYMGAPLTQILKSGAKLLSV